MNWGANEYINRIEILDTGELFHGIESDGKADYQFVYREAAGVYWDSEIKGFKSTELKDGTPSQWFAHIIGIVRTGIGINLVLRESVRWKNVADTKKAVILGINL